VFKWDAYGISAYDAEWEGTEDKKVVGNIDTTKFVRFDKFGIYGIDQFEESKDKIIDGRSWTPDS
jgi:hypothetical protein